MRSTFDREHKKTLLVSQCKDTQNEQCIWTGMEASIVDFKSFLSRPYHVCLVDRQETDGTYQLMPTEVECDTS